MGRTFDQSSLTLPDGTRLSWPRGTIEVEDEIETLEFLDGTKREYGVRRTLRLPDGREYQRKAESALIP